MAKLPQEVEFVGYWYLFSDDLYLSLLSKSYSKLSIGSKKVDFQVTKTLCFSLIIIQNGAGEVPLISFIFGEEIEFPF
jgi:hypothetical protein